ncbi:MAG: hypothetical protein V7749_17880 [Cocleimonas sp.]
MAQLRKSVLQISLYGKKEWDTTLEFTFAKSINNKTVNLLAADILIIKYAC